MSSAIEASSLVLVLLGFMSTAGSIVDFLVFLIFAITRNQDVFLAITEVINLQLGPGLLIRALQGTLLSVVTLQVSRYIIGLKKESTSSSDFPAKPLFFPSKTSHTRMLPVKHSFAYSYLMVGIPIGWTGSVGGMLSVDEGERESAPWYRRLLSLKPSSSWYSVDAEDHLAHNHLPGGLAGKLRAYLESQVCRFMILGCNCFFLTYILRVWILRNTLMSTS